jgi:uncharacterized protein
MPNPPSTPAVSLDLADDDFVELDALLARTPEPLEPLDVVTLDGYLCGVIVQPILLEPQAWLAHVYDVDGRPLPDDVDRAWERRTTALIERRHAALRRALAEDGWFDPFVLEPDPADAADEPPEVQALPAASRVLAQWVAGFEHATACFPDLLELEDDAVRDSLVRIFRHLPAETDEERARVAELDRAEPVGELDDALDALVAEVAELDELTRDLRYKVEPLRRATVKVGRNDPCPCGSGRKFKQCHGAA